MDKRTKEQTNSPTLSGGKDIKIATKTYVSGTDIFYWHTDTCWSYATCCAISQTAHL